MDYDLLDPKLDLVFKRIFGRAERTAPLLDLINAVFDAVDEAPQSSIRVVSPALDPEFLKKKAAVLDIKAETDNSEPINIEIQMINQRDWRKRALFYWSRMYSQQIESGNKYHALKRCVSISFLNFELFERERACSLHELQDRFDHHSIGNLIQMVFIEIPKTTANMPPHLKRWVDFLRAESDHQLKSIASQSAAIQEAYTMLKNMSQDPKERAESELRRRALLDYEANIEGAREEGQKEGQKEGREQGREEGKIETAIRQGQTKFGHLPSWAITKLKNMPESEIDRLLISLLTVDSVEEWLRDVT